MRRTFLRGSITRLARAAGALCCLALVAEACVAADAAQRIELRMTALLADKSPALGNPGIYVADAASGEPVYALNEDRLFLPASNLKLFTSALAMERLGADYRFTTRVLIEQAGDLVVAGSGDPSLSGRIYPYKKDTPAGPPLDPVEDLAAQIVARGIRRIDGDVVGDDRLFPWVPFPPSWSADDMERDYGAPVSALSLDDNVVTISIQPGTRAGEHAGLEMSPPVEFLTIDHRVVTGPRGSMPDIRIRQLPGSRQWIVTGVIPEGHAAVAEFLPVDDPAAFAAAALYDALIRRGVTIRGRPVARHRAPGALYVAPVGTQVAVRQSPPLGELLRVTEKVSQNLHAELILREVGRVRRKDGTTEAGLEEMSALLKALEPASRAEPGNSPVRTAGSRIDDGSGLGRNTLIAPRLMGRLLVREYASKDRDLWISLLPAGGDDGTLEHRLCCVSETAGIRAKTGTLSRAIALSGYALSKSYGTLAFSILVNDFSAPASDVRAWVDKIALALLE